ncbi:MAG: gamma-glutamyltransferase, partial [Hyphomicrobiaceae bacterium]
GNRIILYVVKAIVAMIDWRLDAAAAAALANFGDRGHGFEFERGASMDDLAARLTARGHRVVRDDLTSGLHIVMRRNGRLEGGADPRREGLATGD